jgi:hypothetical protein
MQMMQNQAAMQQIRGKKRKASSKKPKVRPSTAKYGWKKSLSTSMSGRPMSASTKKKNLRKKRNNMLLKQQQQLMLAALQAQRMQ